MRCVIARFPFDLTKKGVLETMQGVKPELVTGSAVTIGRRRYPLKQVGQVITRQDRRDFSAGEVLRAMTRLGFTCHPGQPTAGPETPASFHRARDICIGLPERAGDDVVIHPSRSNCCTAGRVRVAPRASHISQGATRAAVARRGQRTPGGIGGIISGFHQ
jgi:hypothetical protein